MEDIRNRKFDDELIFNTSRSSGPGGQNVNKVNTRVELRFNINNSRLFNESEKYLLQINLANRITRDGAIIITSQSERSQYENKVKALEKFYKLIEKALTVSKPRKKTSPTKGSKMKRMENKQVLSEKKIRRKKIADDPE